MIKKVTKGVKITQIHLGTIGDIELFASIPHKTKTEYTKKQKALIELMSEAFKIVEKKIKK